MHEAVPYHIYYKVLNAKNYGVPQNRERIFIIGIRDDEDNNFRFPKEERLTKRLKDVLESEVDKKYYLSDSNVDALLKYNKRQEENNRGFSAKFRDTDTTETMDALKVGGGGKDDLIKVKSATKKGYEEAVEGDSINLEFTDSETRRDRVGKGVAQTLDTGCNQGVITDRIRRLTPRECFRLMDFDGSFDFSCVSDTQAYKQAGNSIVVTVLEKIINNLRL